MRCWPNLYHFAQSRILDLDDDLLLIILTDVALFRRARAWREMPIPYFEINFWSTASGVLSSGTQPVT